MIDVETATGATKVGTARVGLPAGPAEFPDCLALFLDLDGTVLDIAPTPEAVSIPSQTVAAIGRLVERLDGALAVVTGRSLADVDRILAPLRLPAAALHGAELRRRGGGKVAGESVAPPQRLTAALSAFADSRPGVVVEDKGASVAIHYRAAPGREDEVRSRVAELVGQLAPDHELQPGKMVAEIRPRGVDKGAALTALMEQPPFAGRKPLVFGDDLTDEFAFEAAGRLGGAAVLVGEVDRPSAAVYGLKDPAALREWLEALAERA